jgi:hypothetical protein
LPENALSYQKVTRHRQAGHLTTLSRTIINSFTRSPLAARALRTATHAVTLEHDLRKHRVSDKIMRYNKKLEQVSDSTRIHPARNDKQEEIHE